MRYKFIAVEGNIGAGKTVLADILAKEYLATVIHEQFEENEWLALFYKDPDRYAFPLEMSFLKSRFRQLSGKAISSDLPVISDYYFGKSLVFARNNLDDIQFEEFKKTYDLFNQKLQKPDLIIYLRIDVKNLQSNIRKRGRTYEQQIPDTYLENITKGYDHLFTNIKDIPVLWIEISDSDFIGNVQKIMESLEPDLPAGVTKMIL